MQKLYIKIRNIIKFLTTDIWKIRLTDLPSKKAFVIKLQRIVILTIRNFKNDNCGLRASALTFYTLLSFVPIVAILFGLFKGFGLQQQLEKIIIENFQEHQAVMAQVIDYSNKLLANTQGGIIAGIGLVLLLWSVVKLLNSVEDTLNDIWKILYPRSFIRKFSNYLSILFLAPLALIVSSGATLFVKLQLETLSEKFQILGILAAIISIILQFLPYVVSWSLFLLMYIIMPNVKVKFKTAFYAAVIAGSIYQVTQYLFVTFQVGVASYNAIYGSFAVLPLFLFWIQISWIIFLFGAEISFALQNISHYEFEADSKNISIKQKNIISLAIAHLVIRNFKEGETALTEEEIAFELGIPILLTKTIISEFIETKLFIRVASENEEIYAYQPAKDIDLFTIQYVLETLDGRGSNDIPINNTEELTVIKESLKSFSSIINDSSTNKKLMNI
jgi:membrane protein